MSDAQALHELFATHANPNNAVQMKTYMRGQFDFFGIKAPDCRSRAREFLREPHDLSVAEDLWSFPQREMQYVAMILLRKQAKHFTGEHIDRLQKLITQKSWWDTVDHLAINVIGPVARQHPEIISSHIIPWSTDKNFWLRRSAILFQLKYKQALDTNLLTRFIFANSEDDEFFIRKAIGWVLREYAKTDPTFVQQFVNDHELSPLSVREATKHF